jgi:hypothetical protein
MRGTISQLGPSRSNSPTSFTDDAPNLGPPEDASMSGLMLETYIPAGPIFTLIAYTYVAIAVAESDKTILGLLAIVRRLCFAVEAQMVGVVLHRSV